MHTNPTRCIQCDLYGVECVHVLRVPLCVHVFVTAVIVKKVFKVLPVNTSTTERWSKPQAHWPEEKFYNPVTEMKHKHTVTQRRSTRRASWQILCRKHVWYVAVAVAISKMTFSDGQIRDFSWRLGVGWTCGKEIWHEESCYLQYSMWKDFRPRCPYFWITGQSRLDW